MHLFIISLLLIAGVALLLIELFFIPGFGVAGISGYAFMAVSVALTYYWESVTAGRWVLLLALALVAVSIYVFLRSKALDRMALLTDSDGRVDLTSDLTLQPGDEAVTVSRLAPMGQVRVADRTLEAKSEQGFIEPSTPVIIVRIEGNVLVVRPH